MSRSLPEDPLIRRLVQQARASQLSRRTVLAGGAGGAAALALAACAPPSSSTSPTAPADISDSDPTVRWSNWPLYIDEDDDGNYPTLLAFTEQTGIDVAYTVDVDDNNTYFGRVRDQLQLGQDIGADTVCLTDWMVGRMIRFGYTQELDAANIPNRANLNPSLEDVDFDPGRLHSLPWQGGFGGICWNKELIPNGLESVSDLWNPDYAGKITVLSEMRDTLGCIMLEAGIDIAGDFTEADFNTALDIFREQVSSGQIGAVRGNSYIEDLSNGDAIAGIVWSGDVTTLNYEAGGDKFGFAIPSAGGTLWNDNFLVPIGSPRKKNVEKLIDYYYDPAVAAEVAAWVNYITPVLGAQEAMADIAPELVENQLIFPDQDTLSQVKVFRTLSPAEEQSFGSAFQAVLLGA